MFKSSNKTTKTLVRDVVDKIDVVLPPVTNFNNYESTSNVNFVNNAIKPSNEQLINVRLPSTNSSNSIAKNIKSVRQIKSQKIKSINELDNAKKLAVQEKITRKMNFPYEQTLYKDLIPLYGKSLHPTLAVTSREPLPQKDIEPVLNDFVASTVKSEYKFTVSSLTNNPTSFSHYDGFQLYRISRNWN